MVQSLKHNTFYGVVWSIVGRLGYMLVSFGANVFLARLLTPSDFGLMAIVLFFITIAKVFSESGLAGALVRENNLTLEDYSSVFWFNLVVSIFMALLIFALSGMVSRYYNQSELQYLLMAAAIIPVIETFKITYNARLIKEMRFKDKSRYDIVSMTFSSCVGVALAFFGAGVWAILAIQVIQTLSGVILYRLNESQIPLVSFSMPAFKRLYKFGLNTTAASIIETAFDNIYQLILGKYFALSQAGLFMQAKKLEQVPTGLIKYTIMGALYSGMTKLSAGVTAFGKSYLELFRLFAVTIGIVSAGLVCYADTLIRVVYGLQWTGAVLFMQLLAISSFFYMLENFSKLIFKTLDQTFQILKLEIFKKAIQSVTVVIGLWYESMELLMYGIIFTSIISFIINSVVSKRYIDSEGLAELKIVGGVAISAIASTLLTWYFFELLQFHSQWNIFTFPIFALMYLIFVSLFRIVNITEDIKRFKLILRV
jgi:teichuronic acid exporter